MTPASRIPAKLSSHEHACHFYSSKESLLHTVVPYLAYGLADGEKCLCATDDLEPDEFRDALSMCGCDARRFEQSEQLEILNTRKTYFGYGMFSGGAMLAYYRAYIPASLGRKYRGMRVAVEIAQSLVDVGAYDEFTVYESKVNDLFRRNQVSAICAYDANKFPESFLMDIAGSHPFRMTAECPYLPKRISECFHTGRGKDAEEKAERFCFDHDQRYLACPVYGRLESKSDLGERTISGKPQA